MQMEVDLDWYSRNSFSKDPKGMAAPTSCSRNSFSTEPIAMGTSTSSCSRRLISKEAKTMVASSKIMVPGSPITTTVVISGSPIEFNIYHIPLQTMSIREQSSQNQGSPGVQALQMPTVHFPKDDQLVIVFEFEDDLDSKEARSCYWEVFARDRARFKDRIEQASEVLNPILDQNHRDRVFSKLHMNSKEAIDSASNHELSVSGDSGSSSSEKKRKRKRRRRCGRHRK